MDVCIVQETGALVPFLLEAFGSLTAFVCCCPHHSHMIDLCQQNFETK